MIIRPNLRLRMPSITGRHMLNSEFRLVVITALHCSGVIRWNMESRVMPALFTSTSTGPRSALDLLETCGAGLVRRDVPFVDRNVVRDLELLGGFVIAAVVGRDLVTRSLQGPGYRFADAARSPGHYSDACHACFSLDESRSRACTDEKGDQGDCEVLVPIPVSPSSSILSAGPTAPRTSRYPSRHRCTA